MMAPLSQQGDGPPGATGSTVADRRATLAPALPARPLSWLRRPTVQGVLALAIYLLAWLLTTARNELHNIGYAHLDQISMDPNFYTWCFRWWPYAISHGLNPLFSSQINAPAGYPLGWVTTVPPLALLAAPLTLTIGPIAAFNVFAAIALPVSAWAAFVLCRRVTGKFWPSLVGGAVYGFSAYEMNHTAAGQINLTWSLMLPLLAYLVVLWRDESIGTITFVVLAGIAMALQFYLFLETFAGLTGILACSLIAAFILAGSAWRPFVVRLGKRLFVAYLLAFALALPYLAYALQTRPSKLDAYTDVDLASFILPRPERTTGVSWLSHFAHEPITTSTGGYIGIPMLVVAVLLAVTHWQNRFVRFLTVMVGFISLVALGPYFYVLGHREFTFPWAFIWDLPLLRNAYPSRLMLFAFLALALVAAIWLANSQTRLWLRWPLAILVIAALVQNSVFIDTSLHSMVPDFITDGTYAQHLQRGETVVVVSDIGNAGMLWQADSDFYMRIAGGYINQAVNRRTDLPHPVQRLAHATPANVLGFEEYVRQARIGAILVDGNHEPQWVGIFRKIGFRGHWIDNVIVYPVNGCRSCRVLTPSDLKVT